MATVIEAVRAAPLVLLTGPETSRLGELVPGVSHFVPVTTHAPGAVFHEVWKGVIKSRVPTRHPPARILILDFHGWEPKSPEARLKMIQALHFFLPRVVPELVNLGRTLVVSLPEKRTVGVSLPIYSHLILETSEEGVLPLKSREYILGDEIIPWAAPE